MIKITVKVLSFVSWLVCGSKGAILSKPLEIQMFARFTDCVLIFIWIWIYIVWWSNYGYIKPVFFCTLKSCVLPIWCLNITCFWLFVCNVLMKCPFFRSRQPRRDRHPWPNVRCRFPRTECIEPGTGTGEKVIIIAVCIHIHIRTYNYIYILFLLLYTYIYTNIYRYFISNCFVKYDPLPKSSSAWSFFLAH